MKGTICGHTIGAAPTTLCASSVAIAVLVLGCAGPATPPAAAGAHRAATDATSVTPAKADDPAQTAEERDAQRAWCGYLQALYLRADKEAKSWPSFQQCAESTSTAAPKMLKATADCSLLALQQFKGDPFTPAYAAEVSRCGSDAIDNATASPAELAPYVATLCTRIATCGEIDDAECREHLTAGLGAHLGRAIGAMNGRGRTQLNACFNGVTCEGIGDQITGCIEPLMDALLWLPS